ncbi:centrosome-associated protein CEP250-like isoform X1, partial [Elysia marginata]
VHHKSPSPETSVMFTRLDSERNAKIMKKAVMDEKLNAEKYKEAVAKMDEYVSLPAQRLAHLVRKYMHHTRMRAIEEKVKNSSSVNEEVFEVLDKMEDLQNRRARQWADRMDEMGIERLKLANLLMDTLDTIEQESGIFLIKPMYSYKGRDVKPGGHPGKLSRPVRTQHRIGTGNPRHATPTNDGASSFVPAPTPASNYRLVRHERHFLQQQQQQQQQVPAMMAEMRPIETRASKDDGQVKVMGNGMTFAAGSPRTTWNMQASQPWFGKDDPANQFNTPRILELDVNRMLIGQNNISSKVPFPLTEDRLLNANNNTLRSYVTVNRPTAPLAAGERPSSSGSNRSTSRKARVSQVDKDIPEALPSPHPLPPISRVPGDDGEEEEEEEEEGEGKEAVRAPSVAFSDEDGNEEEEEEEENENTEPPHSPPGSSLYHSVVTKNGDEEENDDDGEENKEDTTLTQG